MPFEERKYTIIKQVCSCKSCFTIIQFCKSNCSISIDEGLLIYPADSFNVTNIVRVLGTEIAGMLGFYFSKSFTLFLFLFQGLHLCFSERMIPSLATRPSRAFNRFSKTSRSCLCHTHLTPAAERKISFFFSSLQALCWPKAG